MAKRKHTVSLYTDGSYHPVTGNGGYAAISPELGVVVCGNEKETTNNRMELSAVIGGLSHIDKKDTEIVVYSDSKYVVDAFQKGWLKSWEKRNWKTSTGKPVKNQDLWNDLTREVDRHKKVKFKWVKGHSDNVLNNAVDDLANTAAKSIK